MMAGRFLAIGGVLGYSLNGFIIPFRYDFELVEPRYLYYDIYPGFVGFGGLGGWSLGLILYWTMKLYWHLFYKDNLKKR